MTKNPTFSIAYLSEILASPKVKTIASKLHPATVMSVVKGVFDDLSQEFWASLAAQRRPDLNDLIDKIVARLAEALEITEPLVLDARGRLFPNEVEKLPEVAAEQAAWLLAEPQTDYSRRQEQISERAALGKLAKLGGAESVAVFATTKAARAAVLNWALNKRARVIVARREMYEKDAGDRFEDALDMFPALERREVGACNSVRYEDYARAYENGNALVWRSIGRWNTEGRYVTADELVKLKSAASGEVTLLGEFEFAPLIDLSVYFNVAIPTVAERLKSGFDLALLDAAQLIGGPNAGLLFGSRATLNEISQTPYAQLLKLHRVPFAILAKTVDLYETREKALEIIPILRTLSTSLSNLQSRAERLANFLDTCECVRRAQPLQGHSALCLNSPFGASPTRLVEVFPSATYFSPAELAAKLEKGSPKLLVRWTQDSVLLDLRTLAPENDLLVLEIFEQFDASLRAANLTEKSEQ